MNLLNIKKFFQFDTAGWIASSALLLCAISGVFLAIPYDFSRAHQSVSELLLFNPAGTFIRNFHYFSAQLFFIFTILHIYDHLKKSTETKIKTKRTWLLLCLVTVSLSYEMISGFILKGDAAGIQARRIIASLLESIPFLGKTTSLFLTGSEENGQMIYVQHIAFGTIILFIGIYDHVRTIWPRLKTLVLVFLLLAVISYLFRAPLGQIDGSQLKGPWFFVGIQEILHRISHPVYVIVIFGTMLLGFIFLPELKTKLRTVIKICLLTLGVLYLLITFWALFFRGDNWQLQPWKGLSQTDERLFIFDPIHFFRLNTTTFIPRNQKTESCMVCHNTMRGLSESHNPAIIGCFACHKGDPYSPDKNNAHRKMILVPGNFSNVRQTCGSQNCHADITGRILQSLMTTQSGIIGVDKFIFGESNSLNEPFDVKDLKFSAADTHLRNLCAGCHLGAEKTGTGKGTWLMRGGGCNACHLEYTREATESMNQMRSKTKVCGNETHPGIDIQVSNDRCKSCHSRSGRISLNYEGWNETTLKTSEISDTSRFMILPDNRVLESVMPDIHHQKGLACIDCHPSYDLMGDGTAHIHKEDAVSVQCTDCHLPGNQKNYSLPLKNLTDFESQMIVQLRKYDRNGSTVITQKKQRSLLNIQPDSAGKLYLKDKLLGKMHLSKPLSPACSKGKGHSRLSCQTCHTAWVPQCIGCHSVYEKSTPGFDLLTGKATLGTWVEYAGKIMAEPPALGVSLKDDKVVTAMPGMVMSVDHGSFSGAQTQSFFRLYAPASGHTTRRETRSCKSCHNNPSAIGFGRGLLDFRITGNTGSWVFEPRFTLNEHDSIPEDGWTGFLKDAKNPYSTRSWLRPFNVYEQKKILEIGACLTCHDEKSKTMNDALTDYPLTLAKRSRQCVLPWK